MSDNQVPITTKVPLTAQSQWEAFRDHHWGRWQGVLIRFDGTGNVLDILDSVRSFTPSEDQQTVTHALNFRSRITETVTQKQWTLTAGNPLIVHPLDPEAYLLFNSHSSDAMVGRDRTHEGFYFEPYLIASGRRTSVVTTYKSTENSPQPNLFSFFREVKEGTAKPWWSEETRCRVDPVNCLKIPAQALLGTYVSLDEMAQLPVPTQPIEIQGEFLKIQFPDEVKLVLSADRFETPYYASMRWNPSYNDALRSCTFLYEQPKCKASILTL
jgi:Domain of unknown function (DUF3598)